MLVVGDFGLQRSGGLWFFAELQDGDLLSALCEEESFHQSTVSTATDHAFRFTRVSVAIAGGAEVGAGTDEVRFTRGTSASAV